MGRDGGGDSCEGGWGVDHRGARPAVDRFGRHPEIVELFRNKLRIGRPDKVLADGYMSFGEAPWIPAFAGMTMWGVPAIPYPIAVLVQPVSRE